MFSEASVSHSVHMGSVCLQGSASRGEQRLPPGGEGLHPEGDLPNHPGSDI